MMRVARGDRVQVLCSSKLDDDTWLDNEADRHKPFWLKAGQKAKLQAVTDAVIGMKVGEKKSFTIPPDGAFGRPTSAMLFNSELGSLPKGVNIGDTIAYETGAFKGDVVVQSITGSQALLDGNHPLAGRSLHVELSLLAIDR